MFFYNYILQLVFVSVKCQLYFCSFQKCYLILEIFCVHKQLLWEHVDLLAEPLLFKMQAVINIYRFISKLIHKQDRFYFCDIIDVIWGGVQKHRLG